MTISEKKKKTMTRWKEEKNEISWREGENSESWDPSCASIHYTSSSILVQNIPPHVCRGRPKPRCPPVRETQFWNYRERVGQSRWTKVRRKKNRNLKKRQNRSKKEQDKRRRGIINTSKKSWNSKDGKQIRKKQHKSRQNCLHFIKWIQFVVLVLAFKVIVLFSSVWHSNQRILHSHGPAKLKHSSLCV